MPKPIETNPPGKPAPKPSDDPLAQAIDKFSNEIEPVATTPGAEGGETPTTSEGQGPIS